MNEFSLPLEGEGKGEGEIFRNRRFNTQFFKKKKLKSSIRLRIYYK